MIIKILSYSIKGIESLDVFIEVSVALGLAKFEIIGLADTAIKESKERIFKAILENGYKVPPGNITINLAPAKIKKRGTVYDLPIALGILLASGQIKSAVHWDDLDNYVIVGELSLNGDVRGVEGFFISLLENESKRKEYSYIIPRDNVRNVLPFKNLLARVYPVSNLKEAIELLKEPPSAKETEGMTPKGASKTAGSFIHSPAFNKENEAMKFADRLGSLKSLDFDDVLGNRMAKIALQLSVIGKLNVLFIGPPGCGKSMLMERVPTILSSLEKKDSLLVTRIHNSKNSNIDSLMREPPFRKVKSCFPRNVYLEKGCVLYKDASYTRQSTVCYENNLFIHRLGKICCSRLC